MPLNNPLFWQSLSFSTAAVVIIVVSIWWLYGSPVRGRARAEPPSPHLAGWLAVLLGLSAIQFVAGALWDGSMHILTGEIPAGADFLWPPHLMIYSSFLIALGVAVAAAALVALPGWRRGERDPRLWARRNPHLGAVALASLYSLLSLPGDALWHALYGIDLTAWSPPHVMIAAMMAAVTLSAAAMLAQARPAGPGWGRFDLAVPVLLGLMLNVAIIVGTVEWELWAGEMTLLVRQNPIWVYPLVGGALALGTVALARRLSRVPLAATLAALAFFGLRLAVSLGLRLTDNVVPAVPPLFILGALLLDGLPWQRIRRPALRDLAMSAAFTLGYAALAFPLLAGRAHLPPFTPQDMFLAIVTTLAAGLAVVALVRAVTRRLLTAGQ